MTSARGLRPVWALVVGMALVIPAAAAAQTPPAPPQPPTETELVFDREVFRYPTFTRRNPFRPLLAADGGPRYEQLSLIGIMYSTDPSASVAVVSTGGVNVEPNGTLTPIDGDAYYLKVGEQIGNVTVRAIHRDRVEVTVSEFDDQISRTMIFASRRPGGSQ
jgi:hypothetical protein